MSSTECDTSPEKLRRPAELDAETTTLAVSGYCNHARQVPDIYIDGVSRRGTRRYRATWQSAIDDGAPLKMTANQYSSLVMNN